MWYHNRKFCILWLSSFSLLWRAAWGAVGSLSLLLIETVEVQYKSVHYCLQLVISHLNTNGLVYEEIKDHKYIKY